MANLKERPPIEGRSDDYDASVRGDQLTAELKSASRKRLDAGHEPIVDSPLFGGRRQKEMF